MSDLRDQPCPNAADHTPIPGGYIAHSEWAEAMAATHTQHQCPGCGLWAIWEPKTPGAQPLDPNAFASVCIIGWRHNRNAHVVLRSP